MFLTTSNKENNPNLVPTGLAIPLKNETMLLVANFMNKNIKKKRGNQMVIKFDLQHFYCGPKDCEIEYGKMIDAEE